MGIESDQFYIGELVKFDVDAKNADGTPAAAGTMLLTIQPPPTSADPAPADVTPAVTVSPATHAHAEYTTTRPGWHEWRWQSSGALVAAHQGRFRVLPLNV
jgi:hypothetical protein